MIARAMVFLSFFAVTACGGELSNPKAPPVGGFEYSQGSVERFVTGCIQQRGSTVARCACLLDQFRAAAPESKLLEAFRPDGLINFPKKFLDACSITVEATVAREGAPATSAAVGSVSEPITSQPARQASDVESCIAEKTAAAMAATKDGSLPIEAFDRLRKECGG